eukprot:4772463-Pleurochrysis_carterae.AAC.1
MSCPTQPLYDAALRVLTCLHLHQHVGLRYKLCQRGVQGHSDSDWAIRVIPLRDGSLHMAKLPFPGHLKSRAASPCLPAKQKSLQHPRQLRKRYTCGHCSKSLGSLRLHQLRYRWTTRVRLI